ncbi:MAG: hypothetical protein RL689_2142 [Planctomycetota bacterium]
MNPIAIAASYPLRMSMTRRDAMTVLAAGSAALLTGASPADDRPPEADFLIWKPAGDRAWCAVGSGGNSTLLKGDGAAILIDCKNAPYGPCLRRESLRRVPSLAMVVNTHHHGDHTGGNHAFSADIEIVAHDKCTDRVLGQMNRYISQMKEAAKQLAEGDGPVIRQVREEALSLYKRVEKIKETDFVPRTTFSATREIDLPGIKATMHHLGPGHTDNDLVIHAHDRNVLVVGDLLFHKMHPFVDAASGADINGWQSALRKCLDLCDARTVVVGGHGDVTDAAALKTQIAYFDKLREFVGKAMKDGKTRADIGAMRMPGYGTYGLDQLASSGLLAMHDHLKAQGRAGAETPTPDAR